MASERPPYQFDQSQRDLWDAFVNSAARLRNHDSRIDALLYQAADPRQYIREYKLHWWQKFLYPFACARIAAGLEKLRSHSGDRLQRARLEVQIDDDLALVEFAGKPLSVSQRLRVRVEILRHQLSPKKVRYTFISASVIRQGSQIGTCRVSPYVYWPARLMREGLIALATLSIASAISDFLRNHCLSCNAMGMIYFATFLMLFSYLSHIAGPERRSAERALAKLGLLN